MTVSTFETRDGQIHIGIPKGDSATITVQQTSAGYPPFDVWTGWAFTFRITDPDTGATLIDVTETATGAGQIIDSSTTTVLNLFIAFLPGAFSSLEVGPNYNWGLLAVKGSFHETLIDDGIFFLVEGPFS